MPTPHAEEADPEPPRAAVRRPRGDGSGSTSSVERGGNGAGVVIGTGVATRIGAGGIESQSNGGGVPRSSWMTARTSAGDGRLAGFLSSIAQQQLLEQRRDLRPQRCAARGGGSRQVHAHDVDRVVGLERPPPEDHLVGDHAERVDVGRAVDGAWPRACSGEM